jgi:hypothetical protein
MAFRPVASRCEGARGVLGSDVVSIAHGNGVLTGPNIARESWAGRSVHPPNTAYAPSIHTPVAAALGFLLPPTRRRLGLQNVSTTHNRLSALNARIRSLVPHSPTRAHERRPRQRQGGGAMQSLCAQR